MRCLRAFSWICLVSSIPATIVLQVVSNVSTLIELPDASCAVILDCSTVFLAFLISISFVLASNADIASAWTLCLFNIIAWANACLNTGNVIINAELIFLTRFILLNSIVFIIGIDCIATLSAVLRSWVLCSNIINAWFSVVNSNWIELSPDISISAWRLEMYSCISLHPCSPAKIYLTSSW